MDIDVMEDIVFCDARNKEFLHGSVSVVDGYGVPDTDTQLFCKLLVDDDSGFRQTDLIARCSFTKVDERTESIDVVG